MSDFSDQILGEREKGATPCSIGTSLALESIGGFGEYPSDEPPVVNYQAIWVNLRTLFRNLYNAIDRTNRTELTEDELVQALIEDAYVIQTTIEQLGKSQMALRFYICSYQSLPKLFPKGRHKKPTTDKQKIERAIEDQTLARFLNAQLNDLVIDEYDVKFMQNQTGNTLLLTHYPVDLLWRQRFDQVVLLESHTGRIKPQSLWYTKLTSGSKYHRIPFNPLTMQVIGDGNTHFASMGHVYKDRLVQLAHEFNWNPRTTTERVQYCLNQLYDPREKDLFSALLRVHD